ncbi:MAG: hypothetical protein HY291_16520 [Planctomycetes bacterium]|nr:hypothetical protein [Planctomycetota bacterium]
MRNSTWRVLVAGFAIAAGLAWMGVLRAAESVAGADEAGRLRKRVIEGVAAGTKPNVFLDVFGRAERVQLIAADAQGVTVSAQGNKLPVAWKDIPATQFAAAVLEFLTPGKSGAEYVDLCRYCALNRLREQAEKASLLALEADSGLGAQVREALSLLPASEAPAPKTPAKSEAAKSESASGGVLTQASDPAKDPAAAPKRSTIAGSGIAASSAAAGGGSGGVRINQEGRALPPIPEIKAPVMFDTPEADALCAAMQIFPKNNAWNEDIGKLPVHPDSEKIVASIGASKTIHIDFSHNFIFVPPDQPKIDVKLIGYPSESDKGPYPVPDNAPIEGWPVFWSKNAQTLDQIQREGDGDRHCYLIDPVNLMAYEFFCMRKTASGWTASNMATWDMKSNKLRPKNWTSADAAGLPIFPGMVRHDELERGMVEHAVRVTVAKTRKEFIYPAVHHAGSTDDKTFPAMGQRLRLKASVAIDDLPKEAKALALGLKKYGMIVADNGLDWDLCVTIDKRNNTTALKALQRLKGSDFEVVVTTGEHEGPRAGP